MSEGQSLGRTPVLSTRVAMTCRRSIALRSTQGRRSSRYPKGRVEREESVAEKGFNRTKNGGEVCQREVLDRWEDASSEGDRYLIATVAVPGSP